MPFELRLSSQKTSFACGTQQKFKKFEHPNQPKASTPSGGIMTTSDYGHRRVQEPKVSEAFPEVFHYTSVAALKEILHSNELWATSIKHLNDSSEMEMIWPMVEKETIEFLDSELRSLVRGKPALQSRLSDKGGSNRVAAIDGQMLTSLMRPYFVGGDGGTTDRQPPFVVSFTTHYGDNPNDAYSRDNGMLSQWRAYGGCEGVAIVFDTEKLEGLLKQECREFEYFQFNFLDAIYYEGEALSELFPDLVEGLRVFSRSFITEDRDQALEILDGKLVSELASAAVRLKHRGFREEKECRIVAGVVPESLQDDLVAMDGKVTKKFKDICYREGRCGSIPYIRLFDQLDSDLPIKRIIVGPSRSQKAVEKRVLQLVKDREVGVELSETPLVSTS